MNDASALMILRVMITFLPLYFDDIYIFLLPSLPSAYKGLGIGKRTIPFQRRQKLTFQFLSTPPSNVQIINNFIDGLHVCVKHLKTWGCLEGISFPILFYLLDRKWWNIGCGPVCYSLFGYDQGNRTPFDK